jgi:hypothetical protein
LAPRPGATLKHLVKHEFEWCIIVKSDESSS